MESTEFAFSDSYTTYYPWIVDCLLMSVIPFIILLILNVLLVVSVRRSTRYLDQNSLRSYTPGSMHPSAQRDEYQITIMLISTVVVFFICQAPYVIYTALINVNKFHPSAGLFQFHYIVMVLLTLKSAVNFIAYCWFSGKFRSTLKRIFRKTVVE